MKALYVQNGGYLYEYIAYGLPEAENEDNEGKRNPRGDQRVFYGRSTGRIAQPCCDSLFQEMSNHLSIITPTRYEKLNLSPRAADFAGLEAISPERFKS